MRCRIHTSKRHPSCCKWCAADTSDAIPLAPSEEVRAQFARKDAEAAAKKVTAQLRLRLFDEEAEVVQLRARVTAVPPPKQRVRRLAMAALVLIVCGLLLALPAVAQGWKEEGWFRRTSAGGLALVGSSDRGEQDR